MNITSHKVKAELQRLANQIRTDAGLELSRGMDLGIKGYTTNSQFSELADILKNQNSSIPPLPRTRNLFVLLVIILATGLLLLGTIYLARDYSNLNALLASEGTVFTALLALATHMARAHNASIESYDKRAAEWLRTDAIIRTLREMTRGEQLSAKAMVDLLDALSAIYPPKKYEDD